MSDDALSKIKYKIVKYKLQIEFVVAWYDLWIGMYYDRKGEWLYILPLPCLGVRVRRRIREKWAAKVCVACGHRRDEHNSAGVRCLNGFDYRDLMYGCDCKEFRTA